MVRSTVMFRWVCVLTMGAGLLRGAPTSGQTAAASRLGRAARPKPAGASLPAVRRLFDTQLDSLLAAIDTLAGRTESGLDADVQRAFRRARTAYKRVEGLLAYYAPDEVAALQGPLETEGEDDVLPRPFNTPGAFPAIEHAIFPRLPDSIRSAVVGRVHAMRERVEVLRDATASLDVDETAVFGAARNEIARVSTLDIAGFDSDRQDDALLDAAAALDGVSGILTAALGERESDRVGASRDQVRRVLHAAADYLREHATFDTMDRLTFIARYSVPASHALADLQRLRGVQLEALPSAPQLWRTDVASVYDSDAFDPTVYAGRYRLRPDVRGPIIALGARMFSDPRLSGLGTRACSTCHVPARAFTDGLAKRLPLVPGAPSPPGAPPPRHTPTLINAGLQPAEFDDERAHSLEEQVAVVLANPEEMGSSTDIAVRRVEADSSYRAAFARAFGAPADRAITPISLRVAIASYVRSLVALNSPFDRAVRGDSTAMTPAARRGFTVFMGKARCGTCHFAPLFNGTQPPSFRSSDPEIIGVPERFALQHARLDPDSGRGAIDQVQSHDFAFKVPTVREAALTAPYMHNGAFHTLDDVIAFYNAGGGVGIGIDLPYQTMVDRPLHLTPNEQHELLEFLQSLTDTLGAVPASPSAASPSTTAP